MALFRASSINICGILKKAQSLPSVAFYHANVLDHYENPRNVGSFDKKDQNVGTGLVGARKYSNY